MKPAGSNRSFLYKRMEISALVDWRKKFFECPEIFHPGNHEHKFDIPIIVGTDIRRIMDIHVKLPEDVGKD